MRFDMNLLIGKTPDEIDAIIDEQAYITACEIDSPNSCGFDSLLERIETQYMQQAFDAGVAPHLG